MQVIDWTIPGADDQPIIGNTHLPEGDARAVLVIAHGFKGYKDYGFMPYLAKRAAAAGLIAHRFNFSHSGMTNNTATFERTDLFEQDTWGKQIYDLHRVNEAIAGDKLAGHGLPVIWFGHSRGGLSIILAASRLFDQDSPLAPAGIIPAASPHVACNLDDSMRQLMHQEGSLSSPSSRTKQDLRLGMAWLKEIEADPDAFDPVRCIARVTCPILLIQGETDTTVRVDSANILKAGAGDNVQLQVIADAGHTFNCPNPLPHDDDPEAAPVPTLQMAQLVCDFAARLND